MKGELTPPIKMGYNFDNGLLLTKKELCSLKKKIEESESTLKMQVAEIKKLQKLIEDSEDLLRLLLSSTRLGG
jgi:hypothetical protein